MRRYIIIAAMFVALAATLIAPQFLTSTGMREYQSEAYGFSFSYPDDYVLDEREVGTGERGHYVITLTRKADLPLPEAGEGPPTITVDVYQNNIERITLEEWLTGTNFSNFKLSDGTYREAQVAGARAIRYRWSGLYEAHTVAFAHHDAIVAVSGMYLTPGDQIVSDFEELISSITLR